MTSSEKERLLILVSVISMYEVKSQIKLVQLQKKGILSLCPSQMHKILPGITLQTFTVLFSTDNIPSDSQITSLVLFLSK